MACICEFQTTLGSILDGIGVEDVEDDFEGVKGVHIRG